MIVVSSLRAPRAAARQAARFATSPEGLLVAIGLASIAAYAWFWTRPFWVFDYDLEARAIAVGHALGLNYRSVAQYSVSFTVPMALYLAALGVAGRAAGAAAARVALAGACVLPLVMLFTYPVMAADVFDYLMIGRIIEHYHDNPYVNVAVDYPDDPFRPAVGWPRLPSVYGPLFNHIMAGTVWLSGGNHLAALMLFKLLIIVCHVANTALVYVITRLVNRERAVVAAVAYGWNPMAVVFFAVDGHNDAIMLLPLAIATWAALRGRHELALAGVTLAALVKFVPVILFPVFLLEARRAPLRASVGLAVSSALALAAMWPLWAGMDTFDGVRDQGSRQTSSLASLLTFAIDNKSLARGVMITAFVAGYVAILALVGRLTDRIFAVLALTLTTVIFWFRGWYIAWPLMFGATSGSGSLLVVVPWAVGAFVEGIFGAWGWLMNWWGWQQRWGIWMMELWLTASQIVPLAVGLLMAVVWRLRQRRAAGR